MRIKKTSETTPYGGAVVNVQNDSTTNAYSCDYINNLLSIGTIINNNSRINILHSKNIFDGQLELGSFTNDGTPVVSTTQYRNVNKIYVLPNTTYTTSINGTAQQYVMHYYDENGTWLSSADNRTGTFTTPANCYFVNFRCYNADFTSDFANLKVQVEKGSTATTYEEYVSPAIVVDGDEIYNKNNLEIYSTSEQRIGTWIDGKPLYRIVVQTTTNDTANVEKNTTIQVQNVKEIVKMDGFVIFADKSKLPLNLYNNSSSYIFTYNDVFTSNMRVRTTTSYVSKPITYIVDYTKTTD